MSAAPATILPTQRLDGQRAIVTGAGRGIGRAAALAPA
jgi:NAD(P)-dependent dehydrogenase (short-subunit alcohol dehydrogenase family)